MEKIHLRNASLLYKKPVEIETALAWNALNKFLEQHWRKELFDAIAGVKITEKNITIVVRESLAKQELSLMKEALGDYILQKLSHIYGSHHRNVKIL